MPIVFDNAINDIRAIAAGASDRKQKAARLAERIQRLGNYRWVGVYDVGSERVSIIGFAGPNAPEYPTFPINKGLTGAAIAQKSTVIVGNVRNDPRYLTALGNTLSEMIVPVLSPDGRVIGTVDVESEKENAFSPRDQQMIERCADAAKLLWLLA
jgi:L-methionine (R)-S-oxide reductase